MALLSAEGNKEGRSKREKLFAFFSAVIIVQLPLSGLQSMWRFFFFHPAAVSVFAHRQHISSLSSFIGAYLDTKGSFLL